MVVADILKWRWNNGKGSNLSFYRDSNGNEVDLVYEVAGQALPIEIKSGQTVAEDWFKGLAHFRQTLPDASRRGAVVYAGDAEQNRSEAAVINHWSLPAFLSGAG